MISRAVCSILLWASSARFIGGYVFLALWRRGHIRLQYLKLARRHRGRGDLALYRQGDSGADLRSSGKFIMVSRGVFRKRPLLNLTLDEMMNRGGRGLDAILG